MKKIDVAEKIFGDLDIKDSLMVGAGGFLLRQSMETFMTLLCPYPPKKKLELTCTAYIQYEVHGTYDAVVSLL
jgi:hypothetical protein